MAMLMEGSSAPGFSIEDILLRAALLAGHGAGARPLARRLAAVTRAGGGRSCLEAGAPLQLTVDGPGPADLRVGVRLGESLSTRTLDGLVPDEANRQLVALLSPLPRVDYASLGVWLFWTRARQSLFIDLREPSAANALARLRTVLSDAQRRRLEAIAPPAHEARPWVFRVEADVSGATRMHVHWLIDRHVSPREVVERMAPGCWELALPLLGHLVQRPGASGRFVVVTPLDERSEPALRLGNSGWALVREDERKHRAVGEVMKALAGPRDHAQALWSLCRGTADPAWRVGRACELKVVPGGAGGDARVRMRLFLTPQVRTSS